MTNATGKWTDINPVLELETGTILSFSATTQTADIGAGLRRAASATSCGRVALPATRHCRSRHSFSQARTVLRLAPELDDDELAGAISLAAAYEKPAYSMTRQKRRG